MWILPSSSAQWRVLFACTLPHLHWQRRFVVVVVGMWQRAGIVFEVELMMREDFCSIEQWTFVWMP
jgi:hypothetical protein